jgi:hypothetical protein
MAQEKNYVLGKGRVYFDKIDSQTSITATTQGEGERYFGNTPEMSTTSAAENLDHFSAEGGLKTKDDSVQLSLNRSGKLTCDNVSAENQALFIQGTVGTLVQTALVGEIEEKEVKRGRYYQLGVDEVNPTGVRKISNVVVNKGVGFATLVAAAGNYEVDAELGRIYIEDNAADIPDDTEIEITYDVAASTREQIISSSDTIYGALRFVADNPKGTNRDYYFPYVKLSPDGDYQLKGDTWQTMSFTFEILDKAPGIAAVYIDGRAQV